MPATPDDLFAFLDSHAIAHKTATHPPLFTVEQSRELRGTIAGAHTKNLFLKDKRDNVFLVVAPEDAAIDLKTLHQRLGAGRFSFGSSDLMQELLGVTPGAVTPFGVINDVGRRVTVVLDAGLMQADIVNAHPLVNTMTTSLATGDLVKFLEATGHPPRIEAVTNGARVDEVCVSLRPHPNPPPKRGRARTALGAHLGTIAGARRLHSDAS